MNERIEELKLKAIDYADATYKYDLNEGFKIQEWDAIRLDEFAKLIVLECAEIADDGCGSACFGLGINGAMLKEHFGVEE